MAASDDDDAVLADPHVGAERGRTCTPEEPGPPARPDPWQRVTTRSGLAADEVISALQKLIRRGLEEAAAELAWEMYQTSEQLEDFAWTRLAVISVEDIGLGSPQAPVLIATLDRMRRAVDYTAPDRPLYLIHAVRYLCAQPKDRGSDLLLNIVAELARRGRVPTIPDYALDMHTRRGQDLGRGIEHFLAEGSRVEPRVPGVQDEYLARLRMLLGVAAPVQPGAGPTRSDSDLGG